MSDQVRVPDNFDELQARLRNAWTKGKAAGESNTSLMNTSKMFVDMFMNKEAQKITPYQQAVLDMQKEQFDYKKQEDSQSSWTIVKDADGNLVWANTATQETKPFEGSASEWPTDPAGVNPQMGPQPNPSSTAPTPMDVTKTGDASASAQLSPTQQLIRKTSGGNGDISGAELEKSLQGVNVDFSQLNPQPISLNKLTLPTDPTEKWTNLLQARKKTNAI